MLPFEYQSIILCIILYSTLDPVFSLIVEQTLPFLHFFPSAVAADYSTLQKVSVKQSFPASFSNFISSRNIAGCNPNRINT